MKNTTHLYILIFPQKNVFKIGKANDIQHRIDSLKRWWGDVDYDASYFLKIEEKIVFKLEKALIFFLSNRSVKFEEGDGKTELFSIETLEQALKHINLYLSLNSEVGPLQKGIPKPIKKLHLKKRPEKYEKIQKKSAKHFTSIFDCSSKFEKIHRLIALLLRFQSRIQFQYDIVDNNVYFRIRYNRSKKQEKSHLVMSLFSYNLVDFESWFGINTCSVIGTNNVIQYHIKIISIEDERSNNPYLVYMFSQVKHALMKLPQRSIAAAKEIPIIDETKFINDFMGL